MRYALTESLLLAAMPMPVALGFAYVGLKATLRIVPAETIPDEAVALKAEPGGGWRLELKSGEEVRARAVVLACGARYRRLSVERLEACSAADSRLKGRQLRSIRFHDQHNVPRTNRGS